MRKEIGVGVATVVIGGVILLPITTWWNSNQAAIPDSVFAFAAYMWEPVQIPRIVAMIFLAAVIPLFVYAVRQGMKLRSGALPPRPTPPTPMRRARAAAAEAATREFSEVNTMPARDLSGMKLDADEEAVLIALTKMGKFADERKLQHATGLTQFRFEHAVGSLRARHFVNVAGSYTNGTTISFKQGGREFAAQNNLDKR